VAAEEEQADIGDGNSRRYISGTGKADGQNRLLLNCEILFNSVDTQAINKIKWKGNGIGR
jgi:hypothetical protein